MIAQTTELEQERIADLVLKRKIEEAPESTNEGTVIQLRTFGRPRVYTVKKGKMRKRKTITYDTIKRAKISANLSNRQTTKFLAHLRHGTARGWIVSRIKEKITESNKIFDDDFVCEVIDMEICKGELKLIICILLSAVLITVSS